MRLLEWIYKDKGYDLWKYKNGYKSLTRSFIIFGKDYQIEIEPNSDKYYAIMMFEYYRINENCE